MVRLPKMPKSSIAQDIAYDAMEFMYRDNEKVVELCKKALKVYPACVDAQVMLAEVQSDNLQDYIIALEKAVADGRKELGEQFFKENKGYFWGLIETRPFMRAMSGLADGYMELGKKGYAKAIAVYEEILELNNNDNQGVRYNLSNCYICEKLYDKAQQLIGISDENISFFNWAKVLIAYATQGEVAAEKALKAAVKQNPYVLPLLSGKKRLPPYHPGFYSPGDENEAIICAKMQKDAWKIHKEAKNWLKSKV
jgi:lipopolysaccharide biosynthesis regulator YciM